MQTPDGKFLLSASEFKQLFPSFTVAYYEDWYHVHISSTEPQSSFKNEENVFCVFSRNDEELILTLDVVPEAMQYYACNFSTPNQRVDITVSKGDYFGQADEKLDDVKDFTRWHKMHPDLAARVRKYAETYYSKSSAMDEADILQGLAPSLRKVRHEREPPTQPPTQTAPDLSPGT